MFLWDSVCLHATDRPSRLTDISMTRPNREYTASTPHYLMFNNAAIAFPLLIPDVHLTCTMCCEPGRA